MALPVLRPLRILPASEPVSLFLNRGGGAKSNAVKLPDFRNWNLDKNFSINISEMMDLLGKNLRARYTWKLVEGRCQWSV